MSSQKWLFLFKMTETELINKIKKLKKIKPRKDWVLLVRERILEEAPKETNLPLTFFPKFAFATLFAFLVLFGLFGFSGNSLPGDWLYPVRKITEMTKEMFLPKEEQTKFAFEIANKRLDDLTKIAQTNSTKNLAPAIDEVQTSVSRVAKNLSELKPETVKSVIKDVKDIEQKTETIKSLGVEIGENVELDSALVKQIKIQVDDLEKSTLTEEQSKSLGEIKTDIESGNFAEALEKILLLPNLPR